VFRMLAIHRANFVVGIGNRCRIRTRGWVAPLNSGHCHLQAWWQTMSKDMDDRERQGERESWVEASTKGLAQRLSAASVSNSSLILSLAPLLSSSTHSLYPTSGVCGYNGYIPSSESIPIPTKEGPASRAADNANKERGQTGYVSECM